MRAECCCRSLPLFFLMILFLFSKSAIADKKILPVDNRCNDLNVNIGFVSDEIDVTGMSLGDRFTLLTSEGSSGMCNGDYGIDNNGGGFVMVQTGRSPLIVPQKSPAPSTRISIPELNGMVGLLRFATKDQGPYTPVEEGIQNAELIEKWPGVTEITIENLLGNMPGNIWTSYNRFDWHNGHEKNATVAYARQSIKLIYRPTCTISVKDVNFGTLTVDEVLAGNISQQANVDVSCNDILLNYDIKISSNFNDFFIEKGVISSNNSTVQYQLEWGDLTGSGLDSFSNDRINLDSIYSPEINIGPKGNNFSIPIKVKPIAKIAPGFDIKPGEANSDIIIQMIFK